LGFELQDFTLIRKVLHCLIMPPALFTLVIFEIGPCIYAQVAQMVTLLGIWNVGTCHRAQLLIG
jgi:hypothetical protein